MKALLTSSFKQVAFARLLLAVFVLFLSLISPSKAQVKLIFDTDMESDVDDVGALAMLHGLADKGEVEILGTMVCSLNPWAVPTVDVINTYFKKPDIPIGAVKTFGVYRNSKYAKILAEEFPHDLELGENAPDAVAQYRKILNGQPDSSVVIVTVGYLSNLAYLLDSRPDSNSPLGGLELVRKKVKHLVCMGGRYPYENDPGRYGNFKPDPAAAQQVAQRWPTVITFTGGGDFANLFQAGSRTFDLPPQSNPVSRAYEVFLKTWNRKWHHSADFIAVYVAVRGWEEFFVLNKQGYNHIFEDGTMLWRLQPNDPRHQYVNDLKKGIMPEQVAKVFDDLMMYSVEKK
ncbi:nucleoside hydrolase [Persicitalea sp.]|uniref:nucleoside hydrolase n=1 Tax=Persicitalea sp. TaxID=3100273 RepID=UPI003593AB80